MTKKNAARQLDLGASSPSSLSGVRRMARRVSSRAAPTLSTAPKDARTRNAMREIRAIAETDANAHELADAAGRIASRHGLALDEALELSAYAADWRSKIENGQ